MSASSYDDLLKWAPAASAVASAVAAIVAAVNVVLQNRNARRNRSVDLLLKKEAEFDTERMHMVRAAAAKAILAGANDSEYIDRVLDFMESVAGLVIDGDLEADKVWRSFYYWFSHYYYAFSDLIADARNKDRSVWCDLVELQARIERLQIKRGNPLTRPLKPDIMRFLESESKLQQ
jgi:hypothetical protein